MRINTSYAKQTLANLEEAGLQHYDLNAPPPYEVPADFRTFFQEFGGLEHDGKRDPKTNRPLVVKDLDSRNNQNSIDNLADYVAKATGSGVKYENEAPDDHDDGVMALALVVHKARTSLLQLGTVGDNMFATYSAETVGDPPQMDFNIARQRLKGL